MDDSNLPVDEFSADMKDLADDTLAPTEGEIKDDTQELEEELDKELPEEVVEKDKEDKKDKEDEEEEIEEEPKGHQQPTVSEIKAKYPDFFKDFPGVKHAIFREYEYSKLFPTVEIAKESAEKSEDFDHFAELLQDGSKQKFSEFLGGIKEGGSLKSMVDNFLPSLYEVDKDSYFRATQPIAATLIRNAYRQGTNTGNKDLAAAAQHLALFALGDIGYADGSKTLEAPKEEKPKDPDLDRERREFYTERYNSAQNYVNSSAIQRLRSDISAGLDPGGVFNDFTRGLLVKEIFEEVGNELAKDARHMATMNSLWRKANEAGFTGDWKDRILRAYLSGARAIMPAIRTRLREAAFSDQKSKVGLKKEAAERGVNRKDISGQGTPGGPARGNHSAKDIDWSKTSDDDFLAGNVTLRKR